MSPISELFFNQEIDERSIGIFEGFVFHLKSMLLYKTKIDNNVITTNIIIQTPHFIIPIFRKVVLV